MSCRPKTSANPGEPASPTCQVIPSLSPALTATRRSEEHTSELQSRLHLVCRLLLEKKKQTQVPKSKKLLSCSSQFPSKLATPGTVYRCNRLCVRDCLLTVRRFSHDDTTSVRRPDSG